MAAAAAAAAAAAKGGAAARSGLLGKQQNHIGGFKSEAWLPLGSPPQLIFLKLERSRRFFKKLIEASQSVIRADRQQTED